MANQRYIYANERFLSGQLNWLSDSFRVVLVDTRIYFVQPDVHHSLADIPLAARVATSNPLTGKTATGGVARADDPVIGPVYGQDITAMVVYHHTGTENTSELVCYLDTAHGLPFTPQGETVRIHWDDGPNGIFKL